MKNNQLYKTRFFCECFFEKCMEWVDFLRYGFTKRNSWVSNLSEHYCIYKDYIEKEYVKNFLDEREKILANNRYKMIIKVLPEKGERGVVGKVILYSKKKKIHEAKLKVKEDNTGANNLIFWSFENDRK